MLEALAALPPGKTRYPFYRRLCGPQGRSGRVRKICLSPPTGFHLWTVQTVAIFGWVIVSYKKLWLTYLLTYLLTPWCRVLLEKLTGMQIVKKFPTFYGTQRFITALTSVRHLSLSWASTIQSTYPHPTSWRSILILPTHLRLGLPSGLFPSGYIL